MSRANRLVVFLILSIAFWVSMLWLFKITSNSVEELPAIATKGLSEVWFFYLPILIFTLIIIFAVTRKREKPDWDHFAVNRKTAKRDVAIAIVYLLAVQSILGIAANTGLHFPGPEVYNSNTHGRTDVLRWVILQSFFFVICPWLWLRSQGFSISKMIHGIRFQRDIWIMLFFWAGEFFSTIFVTDFLQVSAEQYWYAIPIGIVVNTLGAGLPVLIMIHVIIIPRLSLLFQNQLLVIVIAGFVYALFSLFDPGVNYSSTSLGVLSVSFVIATQTLIGMGKASFTVRTGNPFIHLTSYHILGARVAFDTGMYAEIFR